MLIWFLLVLLLPAADALGASLVLTDEQAFSLAQDTHYLEEDKPLLDFESARLLDFPQVTKGSPNFGWTNRTFWLRTDLEKKHSGSYILEIAYPLLDELDVYIERDGRLIAHHVLGDQQGGVRRLRNAIKPAFEFPHEAGLYRMTVRVHSSSAVQVPMSLIEETNYHNRMLEDFSYLFGYVGAVTIMIIYNFFIYLKTLSRAYFHYVLFIGLFLALQVALNGFGQVYLWPEKGSNLIIGNLSYLLNVFAYQFTRSFLDLKARPQLDAFLKGMAFIAAAGFVFSLLMPYAISVRIMASLTLFTALCFLVVASITTFIDKTQEGKFYLIAWGSLIFGCLIYLCKQLSWLPYNVFTHNAFMIGNITQITLLSFGLADRFNRLQKMARDSEKARAEAEAELSLSLKTRVYLVSDMAHRLNNPLNYISTSQANLDREMADLRVDMNHIIDEWRPAGQMDLYKLARNHMDQRFESMKQSMMMMEEGIRRSASSVIAIRQLSGVDGYHLDRLNIHELLDIAKQRIIDSLGKSAIQRLDVAEDLAQAEVYTNRFAIPMVIELIFQNWLNASEPSARFHTRTVTGAGHKFTLVMSMVYGGEKDALHVVEQVLPFLNQILRPYESTLICVQNVATLEFSLSFGKEKSTAPLQEVA